MTTAPSLDAPAVANTLTTDPVALDAAMAPEEVGGLPAKPGFYAWWVENGTMSGVPHYPHPAQPTLGLLYVGISPTRESSGGRIRSRVINQHIRGNTSSSTFRFVLASLLIQELALKPRATAKKIVLDVNDNQRLRDWQLDHLRITWCIRDRPREVEDQVIALLEPPLNSSANRAHPFHERVATARTAFRAAGRTLDRT